MLARVVWKLILAFSVVLAVALMLLWLRTRKSDLIVSGTRGGTYREVRIGGGEIGVTLIPRWPVDERVRVGRPPAPKQPMPSIAAFGASPPGPTTTLLDGTSFALMPARAPATGIHWPKLLTTGTVFFSGMPKKHLIATTMPAPSAVSFFYPATRPTAFAPPVPTTMQGIGTLTFTYPTTMPTLAPGGAGPATSTANAVIASLKSDTDFSFRIAPKPTTIPAFVAGRITRGMVFRLPTYTFERYAAPIWPLAAVILLPVWCAIALATARAARRRVRRRRGWCESCGYDLRGSPRGGVCPECGADAATDSAPPSGEELIARLR